MDNGHHYREEDVGNILSLEHASLNISDQGLAMVFYVVGLGLTRDPYMGLGMQVMWINVGEQQIHLPTRPPQVLRGHIGVVVPDLESLRRRLKAVEERLSNTRFAWSAEKDSVLVTCPWGNRFRCYEPDPKFGDMGLGIPYIEFNVTPGTADKIARFYRELLRSPATVESAEGSAAARVAMGYSQWVSFRESKEELPPFDGHHIAFYVANFSGPYADLKRRGLLTGDVDNHLYRFNDIIDLETGEKLFEVEHEVRSMRHPMYHRQFINRNPDQTQRKYKRGHDHIVPFAD